MPDCARCLPASDAAAREKSAFTPVIASLCEVCFLCRLSPPCLSSAGSSDCTWMGRGGGWVPRFHFCCLWLLEAPECVDAPDLRLWGARSHWCFGVFEVVCMGWLVAVFFGSVVPQHFSGVLSVSESGPHTLTSQCQMDTNFHLRLPDKWSVSAQRRALIPGSASDLSVLVLTSIRLRFPAPLQCSLICKWNCLGLSSSHWVVSAL